MSKVQTQCPQCGKTITGNVKHLGKSVRCPACKQPFRFSEAIQPPKIPTSQPPKTQASNQQARYSVNGVTGTLKVYTDCVELTTKGVLGAVTKGIAAGTKKIPFSSITALQFKEASIYANGFLQFSMMGGIEASGGIFGAVKNENSFIFARFEGYNLLKGASRDEGLNEKMREIKDFIEQRIGSQPQAHKSGSNDEFDKLRKLAKLRDDGIINEAEFQAQKSKLLNGF